MQNTLTTTTPIQFSDATTAGARLWTGRVLSGLAILFLAVDTALKLVQAGPAVETTTQLGYPAGSLLAIGIIELGCLALYAFPRTARLGAVALTGYLGGAIATHLRVGSPLLSHQLFPIYVAALVWGGLYLRDRRVRALLPVA